MLDSLLFSSSPFWKPREDCFPLIGNLKAICQYHCAGKSQHDSHTISIYGGIFSFSTESWKIEHTDCNKLLQGSRVFFPLPLTGTNYYNSDSRYFFM